MIKAVRGQEMSCEYLNISRSFVEKLKAKNEGTVPFVSSNDVLTSWFFSKMKTDINLMVANFRSRKPAILDLNDQHAGNYEANIPYFPQDVSSPSLIRQSLSNANGEFQAKRSAIPATKIPGFGTLLKNRTSIVTNWASFQSELNIKNKEGKTIEPKLHLPIMESNGMITSIWNTAVIFRPKSGHLGLLVITNQLNMDAIEHNKGSSIKDMPFGNRLV